MAIARVAGQAGKAVANETTGVQRAFGSNVQLGSLVTVVCVKFGGSSDAFQAADCIKQAGTATIDTPTLDIQTQITDGGDIYSVGIFSCLVTGAGSLTMRVQGATAGSFLTLFTDEYTGTFDATRIDGTPTANGSSTNNQTAASSGNITTAGAALMVGGLAISTSIASFTMTQDAAWTEGATEQDGTANMVGEYIFRIVASGTTDDASWTVDSNNAGWAAAVAAYKEVGGGGSEATINPTTGAVSVNSLNPTANQFSAVYIKEVFINEAGSPVSNRTGMHLLVWYGGTPAGAPNLSMTALTTDANGTASWSIAAGSLAFNQTIFYLAHDGSASLSNYTCARMVPTYVLV